jgi:hypothetical protein
MRPEDHESDRLYRNILQCAKGVLADVEIFAGSLEIFIRDRLWEIGWYDSVHQKVMYAPSLHEFIKRPIPKGAGSSIEMIYGLLSGPAELNNQHAIVALKAFDAQLTREGFKGDQPSKLIFDRVIDEQIKPVVGQGDYGRGRPMSDRHNNIMSIQGTAREYTIARLKKERPDLADRVIAGELSANAAAIEAGFRKVKTPLEQLRQWWKKASKQERATFRRDIAR